MEKEFLILSPSQIQKIMEMESNAPEELKVNLGKDLIRVRREDQFVFLGEAKFDINKFAAVRIEADSLYYVDLEENDVHKVQFYSESTGNYYRLVNCGDTVPPTVEISGVKMHVTKNQNPQIDTLKKLKSLGAIYGNALDTCCGLGYTAIALAGRESVRQVVTCEIDSNMQEMCRLNPWSRELYTHSKIEVKMGDAAELLQKFPDDFFQVIIHDPPRYALAPQLYSVDFYRQCYRVLSGKGKMYHYTGDPNQKTRKKSLQIKTIERLLEAGFRQARKTYQGVRAAK